MFNNKGIGKMWYTTQCNVVLDSYLKVYLQSIIIDK